MDRRTAIEWLEQIKHHIRGGDEEFDRQRKESIDMAITDMKICEANNAGWISVKDRLPEVGKVVLAFGTRSATTCQFQGITNKNNLWWWKGHTIKKVTHWMPLPEPPKEE